MDGSLTPSPLKAPFPWFGGKSRVAPVVWQAFGNVPNYVEPFFGSGAVLLERPHEPGTETVNDKDGFLANFWRALSYAPDEVALHADWPINENDLHARHQWLLNHRESLPSRLEGDPDYFDAKIAGWWVWGICAWIGCGFCSGDGPWSSVDGVLTKTSAGRGIKRQRPHLSNAGQGINRHSSSEMISDYFSKLSSRLRSVRVCCGDWSRICGPSPTFHNGLTGVFLDPPYSDQANRDGEIYNVDDLSVAHDVRRWCIANGNHRLMRIALCGYDGEHNELDAHGWRCHAWKAVGGYSNLGTGQGKENRKRERIWFSPHCLDISPKQMSMF